MDNRYYFEMIKGDQVIITKPESLHLLKVRRCNAEASCIVAVAFMKAVQNAS